MRRRGKAQDHAMILSCERLSLYPHTHSAPQALVHKGCLLRGASYQGLAPPRKSALRQKHNKTQNRHDLGREACPRSSCIFLWGGGGHPVVRGG